MPLLWRDLPAKTRKQLLAAGFGGKAENLKLNWDKTTSILLGVLAGLMIIGTVYGIKTLMPQPAQVLVQLNSPPAPTEAIEYPSKEKRRLDDTVWLGTPKSEVIRRDVHKNELLWVKWEKQVRAAQEIIPNSPDKKERKGNGVELWLAGENAKPERPKDWPLVSIAVIEDSPANTDVRRLAAKLLDTGTADQVLIGKNWKKKYQKFFSDWKKLPNTQWLYINIKPDDEFRHASKSHVAYLSINPNELLELMQKEGVYQLNTLSACKRCTEGSPRIKGMRSEKTDGYINREVFFNDIKDSLFSGKLEQSQIDGINVILDEWENRKLTDSRWLAYMLATAYHETDHTMKSIEVRGGIVTAYGTPDPETGLVYYGRGLIQLAWKDNYAKVGKLINIDLINNPDKALEPSTATKVLFEMMINGLASKDANGKGIRLGDYFNEKQEDWYNARRIINRLDRAQKIADYAKKFNTAIEKSVKKIDRDIFFNTVRDNPFDGVLAESQVDGMNIIINEWENRKLTDLRWLAYILATTYYETAHTMQPIEEIGRGTGMSYGTPDPETSFVYYGRGFIQLTWKDNYDKVGKSINIDLVNNPDKALEPSTASKILFEMMINGINHNDKNRIKLEDFFNENQEDWYNARKIINGPLNRAQDIADNARAFYFALKSSNKTKKP